MIKNFQSKRDIRSGKLYLWGALFAGCLFLSIFLQISSSNQSGLVSAQGQDGDGTVTISGELKQWHKVTLDLAGPWVSETSDPNPFTDYRMDVTFTNGSLTYVVPGYFAADGNAAETSATEGNVWRAHLSPDLTGTWNYAVSFKSGDDVAITDSGSALAPYNGVSGSFTVGATDKTGRDFRGKGRLTYVGERYLQFAGSGEYFIKVGADAPENFLNYTEFDGTFNDGGTDYTKNWGPHIADWNDGDPTWQNGKGKGIIGAVNYLSEQGLNVFSFLTYNVGGDSKDVWPFIDPDDRLRYDASKLDQWEIVFEHATEQGMYLHFKTQETENDNGNNALDGGDVDTERQLYYRELIARFGHNLALNWNLGEENTQTNAQRIAMAAYFAENDPYGHNIVIHTYPGQQEQVYRPLLGSNSELTGASLQNGWSDVHNRTLQWIEESADAGKQWVVANDEQGNAQDGIPPDPGYPGYNGGGPDRDALRHEVLWGNLMAGGAGVEAYFGYSHPESDLTADDFRSRAGWWADNSRALTFFETYLPFWEMSTCNALIGNNNNSDGDGYCLGKAGEIYAIYLPDGDGISLDLSGLGADSYSVQWYNPRSGGNLQSGSVTQVTGGQSVEIGEPPTGTDLDWVALVERANGPPLPTPTPAPTTEATPTSTPNSSTFAVTSLTLINADTNQPIKTLSNGETLYLLSLPTTNLNLRADVNNPNNNTGSVRFGLNGQANYQTENVAPYSLAGDSDGNYDPWTLAAGTYTVVATPYTGANGGGTAGQALTIQFTIANQVEPTPMPTSTASPTAVPSETETPGATPTAGSPGPIDSNARLIYMPIVLNSAQPGATVSPPQSEPTATSAAATATATPMNPSPTATGDTSTIPTRTPSPDETMTPMPPMPTMTAAATVTPSPTVPPDSLACNGARFEDNAGLVVMEMESGAIAGDWVLLTAESGYTGSGYYQWGGDNHFGNPGNGLIEYKIKIETAGTYRFQWHTQIAVGNDSSEHNDSWLRFPDADLFYGQKGNSIVYPGGSGRSPNPAGASKDGWFKIYVKNLGEWGWGAKTSDHDAHDIFVTFDDPGVYTMQISGRSNGHAVDRIVLYTDAVSNNTATDLTQSETLCQ